MSGNYTLLTKSQYGGWGTGKRLTLTHRDKGIEKLTIQERLQNNRVMREEGKKKKEEPWTRTEFLLLCSRKSSKPQSVPINSIPPIKGLK